MIERNATMKCEVCKRDIDIKDLVDMTISTVRQNTEYDEVVYTMCEICTQGTLRDIQAIIARTYSDPWKYGEDMGR